QRTSEIGIRMALGADHTKVVQLVLRGAFQRVLVGLTLGLPLAVAAGRLISAQLYDVSFWDPLALMVAASSLTICAFQAAFIAAVAINPRLPYPDGHSGVASRLVQGVRRKRTVRLAAASVSAATTTFERLVSRSATSFFPDVPVKWLRLNRAGRTQFGFCRCIRVADDFRRYLPAHQSHFAFPFDTADRVPLRL